MISFASLLLLLGSTGGMAARDTVPPAALAARVRAVIAERWDIDPLAVALQWGQLPADIAQLSEAEIRFPGKGDRDGWMAITLTPATGSPQAIRLRAGHREPVAVAARALDAGHLLRSDDIAMTDEVQWGVPAAMPAPELTGWEVRRTLDRGERLTAPAVSPPVMVRPGKPLLFVWQRGSVHMEYQTTAVATARLGDVVQGRRGTVRLTGIVTGAGTARLDEKTP